MKKLYIKIAVFSILFMLIIKTIDAYVVHDTSYSANYRNFFKKETSYDYIHLGNSLSKRMFDVQKIDSVLSVKSINLGSTAQHFYITHAIFQELIKEEAFPKKGLLISVSPWQFDDYEKERLKYLQMPAIDELEFSSNYIEILTHFYEINEYPRAISPTIRFHNELYENIKTTPKKLEETTKWGGKGFDRNITKRLSKELRSSKKDLYKIAASYNASVDSVAPQTIGKREEEMLKDIIDICRQKEIPLFFYTAPAINMIYEKHNYGRTKFLEEFFVSENAPYINFNRIFNDLSLTVDDFSDYSHLNTFGNKKTNTVFFDSISSISRIND